jgi:hypothetical protein
VTNNTWVTANLTQHRSGLAATTVSNYVLFAGGFGATGPMNVVDIYDSSTGKWSTARLSQPRAYLAATSLGNLAFFGGGQTTNYQSSNVVDIFDATTQTWSTATLSQARYWLAAASTGDIVAFGGGYDGFILSSVVDIYNVKQKIWLAETLRKPRQLLAAAPAKNSFFFGGGQISSNKYCDIVDIIMISSSSSNEIIQKGPTITTAVSTTLERTSGDESRKQVNVLLASWQNEIIKDIGELISNFRRDVRKRLEEAQVSHELVVRHAQQLLIDEQMIFKIDPTLTLGDLKTIEEKLQSTLKDVPKLQEMKIKEFLKQSNEYNEENDKL